VLIGRVGTKLLDMVLGGIKGCSNDWFCGTGANGPLAIFAVERGAGRLFWRG
jgi:hypothetical protein